MFYENIAVPGNKKPPDNITERLPEVFDKGTFKSTRLTLAEIEFKRYGVKPVVPRYGTKMDDGGKDISLIEGGSNNLRHHDPFSQSCHLSLATCHPPAQNSPMLCHVRPKAFYVVTRPAGMSQRLNAKD